MFRRLILAVVVESMPRKIFFQFFKKLTKFFENCFCTFMHQAQLAYLGAYGTHMFALWVWVGDETSKTFFSCSITLKMLS